MVTIASTTPSRQAATHSERDSLRLAAIDVGSNSIHMIIAQADADGAITTLWRMKEHVGLGRLSFPSHRLSRASMDAAIITLARFKQIAHQRQCEKIICVATSAVREATNGGDLIERAHREVRMTVRAVSARDEARLIYLAVRHAMKLGDQPHLIIDIGGGSVEFIVGDEKRAAMLESRKLGASRMTAKFVKTDPISKEDLRTLKKHYDTELAQPMEQARALHPVAAIGTSGTLENIAAMCGTPDRIERHAFEKLLHGLISSDTKSRTKIKGLDDQRKDQIVAGAVLVGEVFERLDLKKITLCPAALREGVLLEYLARHSPELEIRRDVPDPRRRGVLDIARKYDWHQKHSEHVTSLCMALFDELKSLHGLGSHDRELIEYASLLHDIGWHISGDSHHKHSLYLISHGGLKDFAHEEIAIIANIARYHRKNPPSKKHKAYIGLSSRSRRVVDFGSALLRIADGLDRSHCSVIKGLHCRIDDKKITCQLEARSDAELELWGATKKREWFEEVFKRKIVFEIKSH